MLRKLKDHIILALVFYVLTLAQQYGFYFFKKIPIIYFSADKYLGIFLMFLVFTFLKGPKFKFIALSSVLFLNLIQMSHISFYGTQVLPAEIWLLFTQMGEINGTLKEEFYHVLIPILFTIVPITLGWFSFQKLRPSYSFKTLSVLLCLWLIYNPARTLLTGNTWGRQPSTRELNGMNIYLASSYFLGKILPQKLRGSNTSHGQNSSTSLKLTDISQSNWDKIIIVLGESLAYKHMALYGYEKDTTPFLNTLKDDPNFFHTVGLSGGVSTDISVAFFLNLGFGDAGSLKAAKGEHCLFKLAKEKEFVTHFLSIQSSEQVRYIAPYLCASYLNDYRSLENVAPHTLDHQAALDRDLLPHLKTMMESKSKDFIILHQRGSHSPWNLRFSKEAAKYEAKLGDDKRIADYDNSVVEFDLFCKELLTIVKSFPAKTLIVYLSDHGESLGENNRWGHGFIEPTAFEVPIMLYAHNSNLPEEASSLPKFMTHYNLGIFLAKTLGYQSNQSVSARPSDYVIFGNDIDGFAGRATIKFIDGKDYTFTYSAD